MKRKYLKFGILPLIMICILICLPSERKRVKSAEKILTVEYNSGTLKQASETEASGTPVTEYKGLVVKGSRSLTGDDFEYMSMKWKHAESIDLRQALVEDGQMGDGFDVPRTIGQDRDGNSTGMQLKEFYFPKNTIGFNGTVLNGLANLEEIRLPDSLKSMDNAMFFQLSKLNRISYHGSEMKKFAATAYTFYSCPMKRYLDFSGAVGLEEIKLASSAAVSGFDFTGVVNLKKAELAGQNIDFSGETEKQWLNAFTGIKDISGQKPVVRLSCEPVLPLELHSVFSGPPQLKALLNDGTDLLKDGQKPEWISDTYPAALKNTVISYKNPSGAAENTIDTSLGGTHKIQWKIAYAYGNPMSNQTFSTSVEVKIPESAKKDEIYVREGSTGTAGSIDDPVGSIEKAIGYLKKGGTIYLAGNAAIPEDFSLPMDAVVAGAQGSRPVLNISGDLYLKGDLSFKNLSLNTQKDVVFYACGHEIFTDEAVITKEGSGLIDIYGGNKSAPVSKSKISLHGGSFQNIYGGGYLGGGHGYTEEDARINGGTEILLGKNVKVKAVFGGGHLVGAPGLQNPDVSVKDVKIRVRGGTTESIYGGSYSLAPGKASADAVTIVMEDGQVNYIYGGGKAAGAVLESGAEVKDVRIDLGGSARVVNAVYGGGKAVTAGKADAENVHIGLGGSAEIKNLYGAGYTEGGRAASAKVKQTELSLSGGTVSGVIYGAGQYIKSGDTDPNPNVGVEGDAEISIRNTDISAASIYAEGSPSGIVRGEKKIILDGYGTASAYKKVKTIGFFDTLILGQEKASYIEFPSNIEPNLSSEPGCQNNIILKRGSSLSFQKEIKNTFQIGSLTAEGSQPSVLKIQKNGVSNALPLYINGKIEVQTPILVEATGDRLAEGDPVLTTSKSGGNASLISDKFLLQNSGFKLLKKNSVLKAVSKTSTEKEDRELPIGLNGIEPGKYGGGDGQVLNLTEEMEVSADGYSYIPYVKGMTFPAGSYWIRYRGNDRFNASEPVQVTVPEGKHPITYEIIHGRLRDGALEKIGHGESFEFQADGAVGYELDPDAMEAKGGVLSYDRNRDVFTVSNVEGDVKIKVCFKMTPLKKAETMIRKHVYIPYGTPPGTPVPILDGDSSFFPDSVSLTWQTEDPSGFVALSGRKLTVRKINKEKKEVLIFVRAQLQDSSASAAVDSVIHFLPKTDQQDQETGPGNKGEKEDRKKNRNKNDSNRKPVRVRKKSAGQTGDNGIGFYLLSITGAGAAAVYLLGSRNRK